MLRQCDFFFSSDGIENVYSEIAVKIHGAMMNKIPPEDAQKMHEGKYHPFSIFCVPSDDYNNIITRISSLNSSGDIILDTACRLNSITIKGMGNVKINKGDEIYERELPDLVNEVRGRRFRLSFCTPSAFKVAGKETSFPDVTMHFASVIRRMNEFENTDISFDGFRRAFYRCRITDWNFQSNNYNVSGILINGLTGYVDIELPDSEEQNLLKKVFCYATFSGTGGRTGMGMGGFLFLRR